MIFALAGNQNCGKTTLFNQLTGSNPVSYTHLLQLLQDSLSLNTALLGRLGELPPALNRKIAEAQSQLAEASVTPEALQDKVISSIFSTAEQICKEACLLYTSRCV